jgi:hypothetical protein
MTQDHDATPTPPEDFQEYSDARYGIKVLMPKRFEITPKTVDPLSRLIRGCNGMPEDEQKLMQPNMPVGFWDPDLTGELESGKQYPLRVIEYEVLQGQGAAIPTDEAKRMRDEVVDFMPKTLEGIKLPGYEYLGMTETKLGPLPALAFEYRWDGPRPDHYGGDHARVVWALGESAMFHLYYHCSGDDWEAKLPEFETILASFAVMTPEQIERESSRTIAAGKAYQAAKDAGDSEEDARAAGQAAYAAALAAEAAAGDAAPRGEDAQVSERAAAGDDAPAEDK